MERGTERTECSGDVGGIVDQFGGGHVEVGKSLVARLIACNTGWRQKVTHSCRDFVKLNRVESAYQRCC